MNTVKIGDKFEDKSYRLINKAIENGDLAISSDFAKVFQKKGYYSRDREDDIIFDLSIEIWPKNADRYSRLFIIECKSSESHNVPVDDVEEFRDKVRQVAGLNVKAIMVSNKSFAKGGYTIAKNCGMALIEVGENDEYEIVLHRTNRGKHGDQEKDLDEKITSLIKKALGPQKIQGLERLSAQDIEKKASIILQRYTEPTTHIKIDRLIENLKCEEGLDFVFSKSLETVNGKKIEGYYDAKNKRIYVDKDVHLSEKFPFVLAHELGHFFLHSNLTVNQELYNDFQDSEYNFLTGKHELKNDKNWIEWQANRFASSLLMPKKLFLMHFCSYRKSGLEIGRYNHIFLDNQQINQQDYRRTVEYLSTFFRVSKTAVKNRIEDLDLITYNNKEIIGEIAREFLNY